MTIQSALLVSKASPGVCALARGGARVWDSGLAYSPCSSFQLYALAFLCGLCPLSHCLFLSFGLCPGLSVSWPSAGQRQRGVDENSGVSAETGNMGPVLLDHRREKQVLGFALLLVFSGLMFLKE